MSQLIFMTLTLEKNNSDFPPQLISVCQFIYKIVSGLVETGQNDFQKSYKQYDKIYSKIINAAELLHDSNEELKLVLENYASNKSPKKWTELISACRTMCINTANLLQTIWKADLDCIILLDESISKNIELYSKTQKFNENIKEISSLFGDIQNYSLLVDRRAKEAISEYVKNLLKNKLTELNAAKMETVRHVELMFENQSKENIENFQQNFLLFRDIINSTTALIIENEIQIPNVENFFGQNNQLTSTSDKNVVAEICENQSTLAPPTQVALEENEIKYLISLVENVKTELKNSLELMNDNELLISKIAEINEKTNSLINFFFSIYKNYSLMKHVAFMELINEIIATNEKFQQITVDKKNHSIEDCVEEFTQNLNLFLLIVSIKNTQLINLTAACIGSINAVVSNFQNGLVNFTNMFMESFEKANYNLNRLIFQILKSSVVVDKFSIFNSAVTVSSLVTEIGACCSNNNENVYLHAKTYKSELLILVEKIRNIALSTIEKENVISNINTTKLDTLSFHCYLNHALERTHNIKIIAFKFLSIFEYESPTNMSKLLKDELSKSSEFFFDLFNANIKKNEHVEIFNNFKKSFDNALQEFLNADSLEIAMASFNNFYAELAKIADYLSSLDLLNLFVENKNSVEKLKLMVKSAVNSSLHINVQQLNNIHTEFYRTSLDRAQFIEDQSKIVEKVHQVDKLIHSLTEQLKNHDTKDVMNTIGAYQENVKLLFKLANTSFGKFSYSDIASAPHDALLLYYQLIEGRLNEIKYYVNSKESLNVSIFQSLKLDMVRYVGNYLIVLLRESKENDYVNAVNSKDKILELYNFNKRLKDISHEDTQEFFDKLNHAVIQITKFYINDYLVSLSTKLDSKIKEISNTDTRSVEEMIVDFDMLDKYFNSILHFVQDIYQLFFSSSFKPTFDKYLNERETCKNQFKTVVISKRSSKISEHAQKLYNLNEALVKFSSSFDVVDLQVKVTSSVSLASKKFEFSHICVKNNYVFYYPLLYFFNQIVETVSKASNDLHFPNSEVFSYHIKNLCYYSKSYINALNDYKEELGVKQVFITSAVQLIEQHLEELVKSNVSFNDFFKSATIFETHVFNTLNISFKIILSSSLNNAFKCVKNFSQESLVNVKILMRKYESLMLSLVYFHAQHSTDSHLVAQTLRTSHKLTSTLNLISFSSDKNLFSDSLFKYNKYLRKLKFFMVKELSVVPFTQLDKTYNTMRFSFEDQNCYLFNQCTECAVLCLKLMIAIYDSNWSDSKTTKIYIEEFKIQNQNLYNMIAKDEHSYAENLIKVDSDYINEFLTNPGFLYFESYLIEYKKNIFKTLVNFINKLVNDKAANIQHLLLNEPNLEEEKLLKIKFTAEEIIRLVMDCYSLNNVNDFCIVKLLKLLLSIYKKIKASSLQEVSHDLIIKFTDKSKQTIKWFSLNCKHIRHQVYDEILSANYLIANFIERIFLTKNITNVIKKNKKTILKYANIVVDLSYSECAQHNSGLNLISPVVKNFKSQIDKLFKLCENSSDPEKIKLMLIAIKSEIEELTFVSTSYRIVNHFSQLVVSIELLCDSVTLDNWNFFTIQKKDLLVVVSKLVKVCINKARNTKSLAVISQIHDAASKVDESINKFKKLIESRKDWNEHNGNLILNELKCDAQSLIKLSMIRYVEFNERIIDIFNLKQSEDVSLQAYNIKRAIEYLVNVGIEKDSKLKNDQYINVLHAHIVQFVALVIEQSSLMENSFLFFETQNLVKVMDNFCVKHLKDELSKIKLKKLIYDVLTNVVAVLNTFVQSKIRDAFSEIEMYYRNHFLESSKAASDTYINKLNSSIFAYLRHINESDYMDQILNQMEALIVINDEFYALVDQDSNKEAVDKKLQVIIEKLDCLYKILDTPLHVILTLNGEKQLMSKYDNRATNILKRIAILINDNNTDNNPIAKKVHIKDFVEARKSLLNFERIISPAVLSSEFDSNFTKVRVAIDRVDSLLNFEQEDVFQDSLKRCKSVDELMSAVDLNFDFTKISLLNYLNSKNELKKKFIDSQFDNNQLYLTLSKTEDSQVMETFESLKSNYFKNYDKLVQLSNKLVKNLNSDSKNKIIYGENKLFEQYQSLMLLVKRSDLSVFKKELTKYTEVFNNLLSTVKDAAVKDSLIDIRCTISVRLKYFKQFFLYLFDSLKAQNETINLIKFRKAKELLFLTVESIYELKNSLIKSKISKILEDLFMYSILTLDNLITKNSNLTKNLKLFSKKITSFNETVLGSSPIYFNATSNIEVVLLNSFNYSSQTMKTLELIEEKLNELISEALKNMNDIQVLNIYLNQLGVLINEFKVSLDTQFLSSLKNSKKSVSETTHQIETVLESTKNFIQTDKDICKLFKLIKNLKRLITQLGTSIIESFIVFSRSELMLSVELYLRDYNQNNKNLVDLNVDIFINYIFDCAKKSSLVHRKKVFDKVYALKNNLTSLFNAFQLNKLVFQREYDNFIQYSYKISAFAFSMMPFSNSSILNHMYIEIDESFRKFKTPKSFTFDAYGDRHSIQDEFISYFNLLVNTICMIKNTSIEDLNVQGCDYEQLLDKVLNYFIDSLSLKFSFLHCNLNLQEIVNSIKLSVTSLMSLKTNNASKFNNFFIKTLDILTNILQYYLINTINQFSTNISQLVDIIQDSSHETITEILLGIKKLSNMLSDTLIDSTETFNNLLYSNFVTSKAKCMICRLRKIQYYFSMNQENMMSQVLQKFSNSLEDITSYVNNNLSCAVVEYKLSLMFSEVSFLNLYPKTNQLINIVLTIGNNFYSLCSIFDTKIDFIADCYYEIFLTHWKLFSNIALESSSSLLPKTTICSILENVENYLVSIKNNHQQLIFDRVNIIQMKNLMTDVLASVISAQIISLDKVLEPSIDQFFKSGYQFTNKDAFFVNMKNFEMCVSEKARIFGPVSYQLEFAELSENCSFNKEKLLSASLDQNEEFNELSSSISDYKNSVVKLVAYSKVSVNINKKNIVEQVLRNKKYNIIFAYKKTEMIKRSLACLFEKLDSIDSLNIENTFLLKLQKLKTNLLKIFVLVSVSISLEESEKFLNYKKKLDNLFDYLRDKIFAGYKTKIEKKKNLIIDILDKSLSRLMSYINVVQESKLISGKKITMNTRPPLSSAVIYEFKVAKKRTEFDNLVQGIEKQIEFVLEAKNTLVNFKNVQDVAYNVRMQDLVQSTNVLVDSTLELADKCLDYKLSLNLKYSSAELKQIIMSGEKILSNDDKFKDYILKIKSNLNRLNSQREKIDQKFLNHTKIDSVIKLLRNCESAAIKYFENSDNKISKMIEKNYFNKSKDTFISVLSNTLPKAYELLKDVSYYKKFCEFDVGQYQTSTEMSEALQDYKYLIKKIYKLILTHDITSNKLEKPLASIASQKRFDFDNYEQAMQSNVSANPNTLFVNGKIESSDLKLIYFELRKLVFGVPIINSSQHLDSSYDTFKTLLDEFQHKFIQFYGDSNANLIHNIKQNVYYYFNFYINQMSHSTRVSEAFVKFFEYKNYELFYDLNVILLSGCTLESRISVLESWFQNQITNNGKSQLIESELISIEAILNEAVMLLTAQTQKTKNLDLFNNIKNLCQKLFSNYKFAVACTVKNNLFLEYSKEILRILKKIRFVSYSYLFDKLMNIKRGVISIEYFIKSNNTSDMNATVVSLLNQYKELVKYLSSNCELQNFKSHASGLQKFIVSFCKFLSSSEYSLQYKTVVLKMAYELEMVIQEFENALNDNALEYSSYHTYPNAVIDIGFLNTQINILSNLNVNVNLDLTNEEVLSANQIQTISSTIDSIMSKLFDLVKSYYSSNIYMLFYYNTLCCNYLEATEKDLSDEKITIDDNVCAGLFKKINQYFNNFLECLDEELLKSYSSNQALVTQTKKMRSTAIECLQELNKFTDKGSDFGKSACLDAVRKLKIVLQTINDVFDLNKYERIMFNKTANIKSITNTIEREIVNKNYVNIESLLNTFVDNSKEYFMTAQIQYRSIPIHSVFHLAYSQKLLRFKNISNTYVEHVRKISDQTNNIKSLININTELIHLLETINLKSNVNNLSLIHDLCNYFTFIEFSIKLNNYSQAYETMELLQLTAKEILNIYGNKHSNLINVFYQNIRKLTQYLLSITNMNSNDSSKCYVETMQLISLVRQNLNSVVTAVNYSILNPTIPFINSVNLCLEKDLQFNSLYNTIFSNAYLFTLEHSFTNKKTIIDLLIKISYFHKMLQETEKTDTTQLASLSNCITTLLEHLKNEFHVNPISFILQNIARIVYNLEILKEFALNEDQTNYLLFNILDICDRLNCLTSDLELFLLNKRPSKLEKNISNINLNEIDILCNKLKISSLNPSVENVNPSDLKTDKLDLQPPKSHKFIDKQKVAIPTQQATLTNSDVVQSNILSYAENISEKLKLSNVENASEQDEPEYYLSQLIQNSIVNLSSSLSNGSRLNLIEYSRDISQNLDKLSKLMSNLNNKLAPKFMVEQDKLIKLSYMLKNYSTQFKILCSVKAASSTEELNADQSIASFVNLICNLVVHSIDLVKLTKTLFIK